MPPIKTAEEAVDKADQFLRKYYPFFRLTKAVPEDGSWLVEFDVGVLKADIVGIKLDTRTGKVLEYSKTENA